MKTKGWTDERRAKRALDCKTANPSQYATGPKTEEGKAASSQNAMVHGMRSKPIRELEMVMAQHNQFLKYLMGHTRLVTGSISSILNPEKRNK